MAVDDDRELVEQALHAADGGSAGHWPTVAGILADEVRRLRTIVSVDPARSYVVVSIANNGVVHAWGTDNGEPFDGRNSAGKLARKLRRLDEEGGQNPADVGLSVCKILGKPPEIPSK